MEDAWRSRELPVLEAIVRHFDENLDDPHIPDVGTFAERTGMDVKDVARAVKTLSPTYIDTRGTMGGPEATMVMGVTDLARRAVGQWPSPESVADQILRELALRIEQEPDEAKRSRMRAAIGVLGGFGKDLLVSVIANVATKPISF